MFSPNSSILISLVSGVGLLAIVSIAPLQDPEALYEERVLPPLPKTAPFEKKTLLVSGPKESNRTPTFSLRALDSQQRKENISSYQLWRNSLPFDTYSRNARESSDWDEPRSSERKLFFQKEGIQVRGNLSSDANPNVFGSSFRKDLFGPNKSMTRRYDAYEVSFPINAHVGAVFQGMSAESIDERGRDARNLSMAGISFKAGDLFQAKVLAGDLVSQSQPLASFANTPLNGNRPQDITRREREDIQRVYEWQATFSPSDYIKLQTSLYNQRNENSLSLSNPDGGKVSVFLGGKKLQVNVKYNYLNNRRGFGTFSEGSFAPSQDLATLGFVFFLDPSQRYSVYLGNSFHNVWNDPLNRVRDTQGRSPTTFTASFRGRAKETTSFFWNFQNQFYMDGMIPGMPGALAPQALQFRGQGKSFYEYATSLGLEVAF